MNPLLQSLLEPLLKKSIRDMELNPYRTTRTLVDLGLRFNTDPDHRETLLTLRQSLENKNCGYYRLFPRIVRQVGRPSLHAVGSNLIRYATQVGDRPIATLEQVWGKELPRCIGFDLRPLPPEADPLPRLHCLVKESRKLGIGCFLIAPGRSMKPFLSLADRYQDCVFVLMTPPDLVTEKLTAAVHKLDNTAWSLLLNANDIPSAREAARRLIAGGILFGGCVPCGGSSPETLLQQAVALDLAFVMLLEEPPCTAEQSIRNKACVENARNTGRYPILPFYVPAAQGSLRFLMLGWDAEGEWFGLTGRTPTGGAPLEQILKTATK